MASHTPADFGDEAVVLANGVNATTGGYLVPPLTPETICKIAEGRPISPVEEKALRAVYESEKDEYLGVPYGVNAARIEEAGWGIVFAQGARVDALREVLRPLLDHRKAQAGALYREFVGDEGYRPGETSLDFCVRFGAVLGPIPPADIPHYLLLVGDPDTIPFEFQYQLDISHAVGRLCFETLEEYHAYANAIVDAETNGTQRGTTCGFFAPRNPDDVATRRSSENLVRNLAARVRESHPAWSIEQWIGEDAQKRELTRMLGGEGTPSLLFTASHGVGFPCGHSLQRAHQGALLCQEWPGPVVGHKPITPDMYYSADDLSGKADVSGTISFFFACYGGGTPELDDFAQGGVVESQIAPAPFVARLPQRMLSRGALAIVSHVDRAWGVSFSWPRAGTQIETFASAMNCLMDGLPVGFAMDYFNQRYARITAELTMEQQNRKKGKKNETTVAGLWTAKNDARNYMVLGDPAARLILQPQG